MNGEILDRSAARNTLDAVLSSATFRRSPTLRRLLEYLGSCSLEGDGENLKEYRIGIEALGKSETYDPRSDPTVRVQVGRLRNRLGDYYQNEGRDDALVVTLPKGGFSIGFAERAEGCPKPERARPAFVWISIAAAAVAFCAGVLLSRETRPPSAVPDPEFRALWKPYFDSDLPVVISLGIPMWVRFADESYGGPGVEGVLRDPTLNDWPTEQASAVGQRLELWRERLGSETMEPWYHYAGVGGSIGAYLLGKSLAVQGKDSSIVRSNVLSWDSLKASNVIVIGAPKFNPQLRKIELSHNFRIGDFFIHNLHPRPGERDSYPRTQPPNSEQSAALIGRYPNPGGGGWLTVIGSANSIGTWAAAEYLTRPEYVAALNASLRRAYGSVPESFEVVVEADFDDENPVAARHYAIRTPTDDYLSLQRSLARNRPLPYDLRAIVTRNFPLDTSPSDDRPPTLTPLPTRAIGVAPPLVWARASGG